MYMRNAWTRVTRQLLVFATVTVLSFAVTKQAVVAGPSGHSETQSGSQSGEQDQGLDWCNGWCQLLYGASYQKWVQGTSYFCTFITGECWARAWPPSFGWSCYYWCQVA